MKDMKYVEWHNFRRPTRSKVARKIFCPHCHKQISGKDNKGSLQQFFRVKIKIPKVNKRFSRNFNVKQYGTIQKAYEAAIDYRDSLLLEYDCDSMLTKERRGRKRKTNDIP